MRYRLDPDVLGTLTRQRSPRRLLQTGTQTHCSLFGRWRAFGWFFTPFFLHSLFLRKNARHPAEALLARARTRIRSAGNLCPYINYKPTNHVYFSFKHCDLILTCVQRRRRGWLHLDSELSDNGETLRHEDVRRRPSGFIMRTAHGGTDSGARASKASAGCRARALRR